MPLAGSIAPFVVSSPFHGLRVVPCKPYFPEVQAPDRNPGKYLHYDHGEPKAAADRGSCGEPGQIIQDDSEDG